MKNGTSRIVWGAVLTTVFGLGTLRNLIVLPVTMAATGPSSYLIGSFVGAALAAVVLVLSIQMLRKGLQQRKAYRYAMIRPAVPGRF